MAMTATATTDTQEKIIRSVGLDNAKVIQTNPDRPNTYFACHGRGNKGEEKLALILDGLANEHTMNNCLW